MDLSICKAGERTRILSVLSCWFAFFVLTCTSGNDGQVRAEVTAPIGSTGQQGQLEGQSAKEAIYTWKEFKAEGFSKPVIGVVYNTQNPPTCGMPLGGLSTGCIDLDAEGVWGMSTIFSDHTLYGANPAVGLWRGCPRMPPCLIPFLGLSVGEKTWVLADKRMLQGGDIEVSFEPAQVKKDWIVKTDAVEGVESVKDIRYWGHYPIADVEYETDAPVGVKLRAWSFFIPGDATASNQPGSFFEVKLQNKTAVKQQGTVVFNFPGPLEHEDRNATEFGRLQVDNSVYKGVVVKAISDIPVEYAMGVTADCPGQVRFGGGLSRNGGKWTGISKQLPQIVPHRVAFDEKDMRAKNKDELAISEERGTSVAVDFELAANQQQKVTYFLAWFAPYWIGSDTMNYSHKYSTRYGKRAPDGKWLGAEEVAGDICRDKDKVLSRIISWQEALYSSEGLPGWLRDCLINSFALIPETSYWMPADNVVIRDIYGPNGSFFGMLECPRGCPQIECIPCTWYGNQPIVYFFPELSRSTLRAYKHFQNEQGQIPFTLNGLQVGRPYMSNAGYFWQKSLNSTCYVHLVDRQWVSTGDDAVLKEFYESVKNATIFTMSMSTKSAASIRMPDDGGMEWFEAGEWVGMTTHTGVLRLAQLRMAERMAKKMGDEEFAARCQKWLQEGCKAMEEQMWADGYYLNFWEPETGKKSDDVMAYQLDGQWAAEFHGLEDILRKERIKTTLATIQRCNVPHAICGAINFARPDGNLLDPSSKVAEYGTHDMFPPEVLVLAMNYMYEDQRDFGIELARRSLENIVCRQGLTWDMPNRVNGVSGGRVFGSDYYQNLMIWSLPAAMADQDMAAPAKPGGLIDRILQAAK